MKRSFLSIFFLLIAASYGCQGVGPGAGMGEQFQGGTEAGNPPIDTPGEVGGTEAGNPPVGDHDGFDPVPREGEGFCGDDGKDENGNDCVPIDVHKDTLTPTVLVPVHKDGESSPTDNQGIVINPALEGALFKDHIIDFGRNGITEQDGKMTIIAPLPNQDVLKNVLPEP